MSESSCYDCGRPYGNEHGFPDLIVSNDVWRQISPTKDNGGLLCPSCIVKRVAALGMSNVPAAFMSGPLKSVDPDLMFALRWIENLKEQGHGWTCPTCHQGREKPNKVVNELDHESLNPSPAPPRPAARSAGEYPAAHDS